MIIVVCNICFGHYIIHSSAHEVNRLLITLPLLVLIFVWIPTVTCCGEKLSVILGQTDIYSPWLLCSQSVCWWWQELLHNSLFRQGAHHNLERGFSYTTWWHYFLAGTKCWWWKHGHVYYWVSALRLSSLLHIKPEVSVWVHLSFVITAACTANELWVLNHRSAIY